MFENFKDPYHASLMHVFLVTFGLFRADQQSAIKDEKSPRHRHRHQKDSPERIIRRDGDEESGQTDQEVDSDQLRSAITPTPQQGIETAASPVSSRRLAPRVPSPWRAARSTPSTSRAESAPARGLKSAFVFPILSIIACLIIGGHDCDHGLDREALYGPGKPTGYPHGRGRVARQRRRQEKCLCSRAHPRRAGHVGW